MMKCVASDTEQTSKEQAHDKNGFQHIIAELVLELKRGRGTASSFFLKMLSEQRVVTILRFCHYQLRALHSISKLKGEYAWCKIYRF